MNRTDSALLFEIRLFAFEAMLGWWITLCKRIFIFSIGKKRFHKLVERLFLDLCGQLNVPGESFNIKCRSFGEPYYQLYSRQKGIEISLYYPFPSMLKGSFYIPLKVVYKKRRQRKILLKYIKRLGKELGLPIVIDWQMFR